MALTAVGSSELPHIKFPFDLVQAQVLATDGAGCSAVRRSEYLIPWRSSLNNSLAASRFALRSRRASSSVH